MCRNRYPRHSEEEVEATTLARHFAKEEVGAFERKGQAAEAALEEVVKAVAKETAKVAVREIHHVAANDAVEAVAMEAFTATLREIRHEAAMRNTRVGGHGDAKDVVRELRHDVTTHESTAAMYAANAAGEARMADAAQVAATWTLVDGDET
jgi:hypothetical protein